MRLWTLGREKKDFIIEMSLQLMIHGLKDVYQVIFRERHSRVSEQKHSVPLGIFWE